MPPSNRHSWLRAYGRRLLFRTGAGALAAVGGLFAGVAIGLTLYGVARLWLPPVWAAAATFTALAAGAVMLASGLAWLGRAPPPPPPSVWSWLLAGDLAGRPEGGLRGWAITLLRELLRRRPRQPS